MKKHWLISFLFTIFVLIHDPLGERVDSYENLTQSQITTLITNQGFTFDFITQQQYLDFLAAHSLIPPTTTQLQLQARVQASSATISGLDGISELQRAVMLTVLDQINILRAGLPTPLSPITVLQVKTAVQNKINSGAAD